MNIFNTLYKIIFSICILLSIAGCEEPWDYRTGEKNKLNIIMAAFADSLIYGSGWAVPDCLNPDIYTSLGDGYFTIVGKSKAYFSVNGGEKIEFKKNQDANTYNDQGIYSYYYKFKAGDKIDIDISCGSNYTPITASVTMPDKPEIEAECLGYETNSQLTGGSDSLMIIKLKIKDNGIKENFYMLNIASYSIKLIDIKYNKLPDSLSNYQKKDTMIHSWGGTDYFYSNDLILDDGRVSVSNDTSIKEFVHPLFSDMLFDGKDYECIVKCKIAPHALPELNAIEQLEIHERRLLEIERYIVIRLDELSEDYYKYMKQAEEKNTAAIPVSNINGGYGILGAVNRSDTIRLDVK